MINGINHINIAVSDIERSFLFYKDILGFKPLCKSEGSAYFLAGNPDDLGCVTKQSTMPKLWMFPLSNLLQIKSGKKQNIFMKSLVLRQVMKV